MPDRFTRLTRLLFTFLWVLVYLCKLPGSALAQNVPLAEANRITDRQGLPQAFVPALVQDHQGFIWAATRDGLCRYDGYRFKVFQPRSDGGSSLSFAGLNQLTLDAHGKIWIVSDRGDIDCFDPLTETFHNLSNQPAFQRLVNGVRYRYLIYLGAADELWITLYGHGVIRWNTKENTGRWFHHLAHRPGSLTSNYVSSVVADQGGRVWLATEQGLNRFDPTTQQFASFQDVYNKPNPLPDSRLLAMLKRPDGQIVLLAQQHLSLLNPATGRLKNYPLPIEAFQFYRSQIVSDRRGVVYFNKDANLFRFTEQQGIRVAARQQPNPNEDCASLLIDKTNVLWEGMTGAGIRTYSLQPNPFQTRLYQRTFILDLLTSGELGLAAVNPSVAKALNGLSSYRFRATFDASGKLWFSVGPSATYRLDPQTGTALPVPLPDLQPGIETDNQSCPLTTDAQGHVWAISGDAAFWYDDRQPGWRRFAHPMPRQPPRELIQLVVDARYLWVASRMDGLWRVDRKTGHIRQFTNQPTDDRSISSNSLYCLSADPTDPNRLWIGTFGNGLCLFDKRTGNCRRFSQANGLPNNVIYSALADAQGYLWMGTNKGLCRMNRRTFATQTFRRDDGLLADEFNRAHYLQFPNGTLLMGGLEGFTVFQPRQIRQDTVQPSVELTELFIDNQLAEPALPAAKEVEPQRQSPLGNRPIQATDRLVLDYDQNYLTVHFAALQFNQPSRNQYRYRLEGLEKKWTQTERPEAVYTNLPPDRYVLIVNASNTSGVWSRHVRRLAITIRPPIWATWWAISLYGLLMLGIGWGLVWAWLHRLRLNQLRAVDALKTTFFTNITHDLRTPLTLMLAPTQQMLSESRPANDVARLSTVERQAHQLLGLVNQWLEVAKLEAGALPVHRVWAEPATLVAGWVDSFVYQAEQQGVALGFSTTLNGAYQLDVHMLERIVTNLLANALKFTPAGGHVAVALMPGAHAEAGLRLTVRDTGAGISADALPHIFDRFYQQPSKPPTQSVSLGGGIGLSLVQELVRLQGGTISVQSTLGQGTTFDVWLPSLPADPIATTSPEGSTDPVAVADSGVAPRPAPLTGELATEGAPRILLVEDNAELAHFITNSLPPTYQLTWVQNGQQGLEQALADLPDLIISDVMMPVMNGYELCRQVKTDLRINHIPLMLLTAKASLESRLDGLGVGADDYVTKPFHVGELQLRVANLLTQRSRLRAYLRAQLTTLDTPDLTDVSVPPDPFITQLYTILEAHLDQSSFGVEQLANEVGLSRSYLFRKVKALTGLSASELARNYRLLRATQYLQQGLGIAESGYLVGFESPAYFTQSFRQLYQMTPTDYLRQQNLVR